MILNSHSAAGKCQLNVMLRQEFREAHDVLILISHLKWKIKQLFFFFILSHSGFGSTSYNRI